MDEQEAKRLLIEILYVTANEAENTNSIKDRITPELLVLIYRLAKKHDLAHVVSRFVYNNKIEVEPDILAKMQRQEILSVYRCEQMKHAYEEICSAFDEIKIAYVPLKGAILRSYYPYESMRTSCDIDVLVRECDIDAAISSLESKGYRCASRNYHDVSLHSPTNVHLELHFNIQEKQDRLDSVLKDAWDYAVPVNGNRYAFSDDFFVFHIFAHMAYHFIYGGCGLRALLDIWILEQKMGLSCSCAKELLEKAGIYQFALEMSNLAQQCFTHNNADVVSDPVLKYILKGGVYGCTANHIATDKAKSNCVGYALKRLFLPYRSMVELYPFLRKAPFLLPFCWIARGIKAIADGKTKRIALEVSCANNVPDEKIEEIKQIHLRLGL